MAEYIEREKVIKELREAYEYNYPTASGDFDEYASQDVPNIIRNIPAADVQPIDTKEILRHLDSLMICVGNAYDTSHYLLQSDMDFIEKQEKIIKGLLSNETIKG